MSCEQGGLHHSIYPTFDKDSLTLGMPSGPGPGMLLLGFPCWEGTKAGPVESSAKKAKLCTLPTVQRGYDSRDREGEPEPMVPSTKWYDLGSCAAANPQAGSIYGKVPLTRFLVASEGIKVSKEIWR